VSARNITVSVECNKNSDYSNVISLLFRKTIFFRGIPFSSIPFRASELALPRNSECLGMRAFFRGITETIPSLFRGIFSERNSVPNPISDPYKHCEEQSYGHILPSRSGMTGVRGIVMEAALDKSCNGPNGTLRGSGENLFMKKT
jgi:hypothetical protein